MTIGDWLRDFEEQALLDGDSRRLHLTTLHNVAFSHRQSDPPKMLAVLEEGRRLALTLEEPWWVAFFENWKLETLIYYLNDYREVIDHAVRLTLELRKPIYERFPIRFNVHCNLVAAYLCVDPRGHAGVIREAIAYLQTQVPSDGGQRYLLQARRHWFACELGNLEEAEKLALEELAMADSDPERYTAQHHEIDTYRALCWIAFDRDQFQSLATYAHAGEARARPMNYLSELALFQLWLAVCARRDGRIPEANRLRRQGTALMSRLGQPPGESYFDALAALHEYDADLNGAWMVREQELATIQGKGHLAYECQIRLERVRLLRDLGRSTDDEVRATGEALARLRDPSWYRNRLEGILARRES